MDLTKKFFLLGIGGSGMSSLAHILLDAGLKVIGYDKKPENVPKSLLERGVNILESLPLALDFDKQNVVFSSALKENQIWKDYFDSNLIKKAFHRSQVLHGLFSKKNSISVAGSHGKTSTTAMVSQALLENGQNPSFMIGGEVFFHNSIGGCFGSGNWAVYESDESDGTFLNHSANIRILTNIDNDHLDYYETREKLESAFQSYLGLNRPGHIIVQGDDPGIQKVLLGSIQSSSAKEPINSLTIILQKNSPLTVEFQNAYSKTEFIFYEINDRSTTLFLDKTKEIFELKLSFEGDHYLRNAICAFQALRITGVTSSEALLLLEGYRGVKRRQELLGKHKKGFLVFDDYGHHPTEIKAVEKAMLSKLKDGGRLFTVFQPHRYTRTQILYKDFAESLLLSHEVFLLPIYSAGEPPIEGVSSALIYDSILNLNPEKVVTMLDSDLEMAANHLLSKLEGDDILLTIGAGSVRQWGEKILLVQN